MGFLGPLLSKVRSVASTAFGRVGGAVKRFGEVGGRILHGIGKVAPYIADGLSAGALALGHPEIAGAVQGVSRAIHYIGHAANTGAAIADRIKTGGQAAQAFGSNIGGGG
jgi:hypothetical protein